MKTEITDHQLLSELRARPHLMDQMCKEQHQDLLQKLMDVNSKLVAAEKIKSDFLSNIRNEIVNPITGLLDLSARLTAGTLDAARSQKVSSLIFNEVHKLDFQIRNILVAAELEAGAARVVVSQIEMDGMIRDVVNHFTVQAQKRRLVVEINPQLSGNFTFRTDVEKLHLIIANLLANAIQFSHEEGKVEIIYGVDDDQLMITVRDYGIGMEEEDQEQIFSRFHQLNSGTTKAYEGHGLGLSLVQALLELIGGALTLDSEPNVGSVFTVHIPEQESGGVDFSRSASGNDFLF